MKLNLSNELLNKELLNYTILDKDRVLNEMQKKLTDYKSDIDKKIKSGVTSDLEEYCKNELNKFLNTVYSYNINTHNRIDSVIKDNTDNIKVLIEYKSPLNTPEMITEDNFNKKAFHELLLYYYEQRKDLVNTINHLIITDCKSIYLFNSNEFETVIKNKKIASLLKNYKNKELSIINKTSDFYNEVSKLITSEKISITASKIDLFDDEIDIDLLYRMLDKHNLLKTPLENDANELNKEFYQELLYIMGLKEKENKLVKSTVKNTLLDLTEQKIGNKEKGEQLFDTALGLNILWLNRILFLKILESQLKVFRNDPDFHILDSNDVTDYYSLSKLFFEILSKPRTDRHSDDIKYDAIPYLNSSLFEETALEKKRGYGIGDLDIDRPIKIKSDSILYKDKQFKKESVNVLEYILLFLNCFSYNSDSNSVDKNTVIKSSVLGTVFERLNGYKDGSHFTPASITMYMSEKVLQKRVIDIFNKEFALEFEDFTELSTHVFRNYSTGAERQKAQALVDNITIIDPAVGSGHFLVSCLNEMIRIKSKFGLLHKDIQIEIQNDELIIKSSFGDEFVYEKIEGKISTERQEIQKAIFDTKKHIIENQLYGVDINPNSVNICRLRLWIELLKHTYYKDNNYIDLEVLPNLEFKVMTANSLIELKKEQGTLITNKYEPLKHELQQKFKKYYTAYHHKDEIKSQILEILEQMKSMTTFSLDGKDQIEQLQAFSPFNTTVTAPFFDSGLMFGVEGFDIVLMNPPYYSLQSIAKKDNPYQGKIFDTYSSSGDIYQLFMERAFHFIHDEGIVSAIVSNKWMRAGYGEGTREWLYKNAFTHEVLDLGANWFNNAIVDVNIITYEKRGKKPYQEVIPAYTMTNKVETIKQGKTELKHITSNEKGNSWIIVNKQEEELLEKMKKVGKPLKDWDISINSGIKTGCNNAFIIDGNIRSALIEEDPKSEEIIKPLLKGTNIKRYSYEFADLWLIFIPWHFPLHKNKSIRGNSLEAEQEFEKQYPAIYKHLLQYKDTLSARNKAETGIRYEWYALQRCAATYLEDFDKPKIIFNKASQENTFHLDDTKFYGDVTTYILTTQKPKFLGAILNSKMFSICYPKFYAGGGIKGELTLFTFEQYPIPEPTPEIEQQITELVTIILANKEQNIDTTLEEQQIDQLVYKLYGLSDQEIQIVEGKE